MAAEQTAQYFARHAGGGPGRDGARRNNPRISKTGFFSGGTPAFKHGDLMTIDSQLVGSGDANDACAYDGDLHAVLFA